MADKIEKVIRALVDRLTKEFPKPISEAEQEIADTVRWQSPDEFTVYDKNGKEIPFG